MDFPVPSMACCYRCDYFWIVLLFFRESFCLFLHSMSALQPFPSGLSAFQLQDPSTVWRGRAQRLFVISDDFAQLLKTE